MKQKLFYLTCITASVILFTVNFSWAAPTLIYCQNRSSDNKNPNVYEFDNSYPATATCPAGKTLVFYSELGHAQQNTDWNNNQYCKTWVQKTGNGISCQVLRASMVSCSLKGVGVCE